MTVISVWSGVGVIGLRWSGRGRKIEKYQGRLGQVKVTRIEL